MPKFGANSTRILRELHPDLASVAMEAIKHIDFSLICGYRNRIDQERAFASGASRAHYGQSPHNFEPYALAFDFLPYPFTGWQNIAAFNQRGLVILDAAKTCGVPVTWGKTFKKLKDYPHFELANWRKLAKG